ncbi:ribosome biogenesis GTPase YlqF [Mesoplasma lactucae]|uniref:Ribosome biogenesis GTPase A n=1 Tax=Mesoplasma lactucae ATCC 49193 TaxID=81460 RepID=A0A291IRJ4_9MOLU|nr:ribosome biogenesis GTPase YlqF [Mesoplasma lactucae]ATG97317.1 ribosome biogenesis GTPase YlqF [Mesoplasma lactucae ATCC 49193]ATZ20232.1 ribosomal biogenesis GTPase [Mesoplasma lactucae ATCC 49193]MCL8216981.1 Ribosome biogenesis GTPase A [Mesoplasma lactucae ATCC 49193]
MASANNWFPGHMNKALKEIENLIEAVDVVVEVVDARAPYSSQNPIFRRVLKNKAVIYVMNKVDVADPEITKQWDEYFKTQSDHKYVLEVEKNSQNITNKLVNLINEATKERQEKMKRKGLVNPQINALVIGLPNVGKSTFINKIVKGKKVKAGNKPGLTRGLQRITLTKNITLIDTPGIMPSKIPNESTACNLTMINSVKEGVFSLERMAARAMRYVYNNYPGRVEERYDARIGLIPPIEISDTYRVFEKIAKKNNWVLLNDMYDVERVMLTFVRDLQNGKLGRMSFETPEMIEDLSIEKSEKDEEIEDKTVDVTQEW